MPKSDTTLQEVRENEALKTPTDLNRKGVGEISSALRQLLADVFALYVKTKNFHWHMSGRSFPDYHLSDYHLLLDEHAAQIFDMTDAIAERSRKLGEGTIRSIGDISRHQRLKDNNDNRVGSLDMLAELLAATGS